MSKPQRIDDHAFFGGSGSPKFPMGNKMKEYSSAEGAGHEGDYEDRTEDIKAQQELGISKVKDRPMKPNHRN